MKLIQKLKKYGKDKRTWIVLGVIILGLIAFNIFARESSVKTETISRGDFIQTTRVSGKVVALAEAGLTFNVSGKVASVNVSVGDEVKAGDVLAYLDRDDLQAGLSEAQANLLLEQRELEDLESGTRGEEITIQQVELEKATETYYNALDELIDAMKRAYNSADTLYTNGISQVFTDPFGIRARIIPIMNVSGQSKINSEYQDIRLMMDKWADLTVGLNSSNYTPETLWIVQDNLNSIQNFSTMVGVAVNDFEPAGGYTQSNIDTYQTELSSDRSGLDTSIANLTSASKTFDSANNDVKVEKSNLALLEAGSTPQDIAIQKARISAESARVRSAASEANDAQIVAPFDGVIAKKEISVGEYVDSTTEAFVLVGPNGIEIESYIPELLIRNVTAGDKATLVFDAYPNSPFDAVVSEVDPKDTLRDGVTTYKTILEPMNLDETPIRIGMTVDILIEAFSKGNTLLIPSRAIFEKNGKEFVIVVSNGNEEREVTIGERDSNGNREILNGLNEGEVVLLDPEV